MAENPKLLVVDDEQVICEACRRIFSRQGFQIETSTDAQQGLEWAIGRDYAGVLLDIKMPRMDGIEFLEKLRASKPDLPVLIMTGYPSIPNATAAIRLGIADYVTKPFTPEEISIAVQRLIHQRVPSGVAGGSAGAPRGGAAGTFLFHEQAWLQLQEDGSVYVGAVLAELRGGAVVSVRLPRIGEVVYQGLPLAGVVTEGRTAPAIVCAPVSGVVAGVNELLTRHPGAVLDEPCREGWLASLWPTRLEEEISRCRTRGVLLASAQATTAEAQMGKLRHLGCQVGCIATPEQLPAALKEREVGVLLIDAASFGEQGPEMARQVNLLAPDLRVVVLGSPDGRWETAYRQQRIFYYAVDPFPDNEIAEILEAAFLPRPPCPPPAPHPGEPGECLYSIATTNRNGHTVQLIAEPGMLWRHQGLGAEIIRCLLDRSMPTSVTPGQAQLDPSAILKAAAACDRLMVLTAKDSGQLPGSLARDTKAEFGPASAGEPRRITALTVQPDENGGLAGVDPAIVTALAEHLVREMGCY